MHRMDLIATSLVICLSASYLGSGLVCGTPNIYDVLQFGASGSGVTDDSQAFLKAWKALCVDSGVGGTPTLLVPAGGKFLLLPSEFEGPCTSPGVNVQILGSILAPNTLSAWRGCSDNSWIVFSNINGLIVNGRGLIDGQGSIWWDQSSSNDTPDCKKPTGVRFRSCNNLQLSEVNFQNSPRNHISINTCNVVTISNIHITAPEDSPNTDGIDISTSTQVHVHDSTIETGDDCIAINNGSSNINITNVACGPGHGISVGSLGEGGAHDTVQDVFVRGCTFTKTQNGARIKTWQGGSGYAKRITFEQITLVGAKNPIIIDQHYDNNVAALSLPAGSEGSAVQISDVTFSGFQGSSASQQAITLSCSEVVGCTNVVMNNVNITSAMPGTVLTSQCNNVNGTSSSTVPQVPCLSGQ